MFSRPLVLRTVLLVLSHERLSSSYIIISRRLIVRKSVSEAHRRFEIRRASSIIDMIDKKGLKKASDAKENREKQLSCTCPVAEIYNKDESTLYTLK